MLKSCLENKTFFWSGARICKLYNKNKIVKGLNPGVISKG